MASLTLATTATVPSGSTLYVTVEEDPDGDGDFENAATTTVPDGTAEQTLDGFDATKGNDIRVYRNYEYSTGDGMTLSSADVTNDTTPNPAGDLDAQSTLDADVDAGTRNVVGDLDAQSTLEADVDAGTRRVAGGLTASSTLDAVVDTGPVSVTGNLDAESSTVSAAKPIQEADMDATSTLDADARASTSADLDAASESDGDVAASRTVAGDADASSESDGDVAAVRTVTGDLDASSASSGRAQATQSVEGGLASSSSLGGPAEGVMAADMDATSTLDGPATPTVAADMDATSTLGADVAASRTAGGSLDAESTTDGDASTPSFDVVGNLDAESTTEGYLEADQLDTVTATRNEDGTVTVEWTITEQDRSNSAFKIDERVNGLDWEEIATVDDPDGRSYVTDALPDAPETFEYRVRGIAAGRVASTLAADEKLWAQESSIRSFDTVESGGTQAPPGTARDGAGGSETVRVPRTVATGWEREQTRHTQVAGAAALAGEGTALRLVADRLSEIGGDEDDEPVSAGDGTWEFGVPQRFDTALTPDPGVDWPVTLNQTYALRIDNPDYLESIDAFANAEGECTVNTRINNVRVIDGGVVFTLQMVVDCPTGTGTADIGGGFVPNPSNDAPSGTSNPGPFPGPADSPGGSPSSGGGSGGGGGTGGSGPGSDTDYRRPITRYVSLSGACVPQGTNDEIPIRIGMEHAAIDAYDLHISFDPSVIQVTGASAENMAPTIEQLDNENGYLHLTSDAGASLSFNPYSTSDEENRLVASYIEYEAVGGDGDQTSMELLPRSEATLDGREIPRTSYSDGGVTIGAGYMLPSRSVPWGDTINYTVGTETGAPVETADVTVTFPAGPVTVNAVKSAGMNVESYSFPEAGVLQVEASTPYPERDLDLFDIVFEAYQPDGPGDIRPEKNPEVAIDGALSTLVDNRGDEIATPCMQTGSVTTQGNIDPEDPDGSGDRLKIPEVGIVYWPILLPITLEATGINTDLVTEDMVRVSFQSETNDVNYTVTDVVVAPEDDPTAVRVFAGVEIPKADPQEYPVDLAGQIWFAQASSGFGSGLVASQGVYIGVAEDMGLWSGSAIGTGNFGGRGRGI